MSMDSAVKSTASVENELFNSSPFTISERDLFLKFRNSPKRAELLDAFKQSLELVRCHVDIDCMMLGGSLLNANNQNPKDIDASIFYRKKPNVDDHDIGDRLIKLVHELRCLHIDARFVPVDGEAWILVKLTSFLTCLYTSQKGSSEFKRNGVVIVVSDAKCLHFNKGEL